AHLVPEKSSASLSADYVSFLSEILWQELSKLEGIEKLFSAQQVAAQLQQAWDKPVAAKLTTSPRWPVPDELKVPLAIVQQYQTWQDVTASDPQWHENLMHQALNWTIFVQWKQKNHQAKIKTAKLWELAAQEEDLGQLIQSLGRLASEGEAYLEKYQAGQSTPPEMSWAREVFGQAPNEKVSNIKQDVTSLQEVLEIAKILELQKAGKVGLQLHHLLDVIDPQTQQLDVAQTKRNYNGYFAVLSGMILDQYPWLTKLRYSSTNSVNAFSPRTMVPGTGRSSEGAEISRPYLDALTTVARNLAKFSTGPAVNRQHYNYWAQEGRKIVQQLNQDLRQNITQSIRQTMGAKNYKDISSLLTTSAYFSQNFMQQYEAMGKMIINWSAAQELQGNGFLPDLGELISTEVVTRGFNCLLLFDLIGPLASGLSLRVSKSMLQWARQGAAVGRWARWRNTATTSVGKGLHWLGVTVHDAKTYYLPQDLRDMFGMGAMLFIIGDLAVQSQQTFFGPIMRNVETKQAMQNLGYTQKMNLTNDDDVAKARAVVTGGTTGILINVVTLAAFAYIFRGVNWFEKPRTVARSGEAVKNQQNIAIRNNAYERMGNKVEVQETKIRAQTKDSPEAATAEDAVSKEVQTGEERTAYIVFAKTKGMDAANLRQELAAKLMATGRERFVALAQQVQEGASTKTQAKIP
ncbi:MAG: hypothetical protein J6Y94_07705, partial [Bacteriovoracaceae bacterium]|nr:hypothetical protein [Bacteriovoracaceae bacterium]